MYIKSPLNYIGGKYKILSDIIQYFPPKIDTFVDLFAGGFNVGINVNADKIVCNDQLTPVIDLYSFLQNNSLEVILEGISKIIKDFDLSLTNKEGYNKLRDLYNREGGNLNLFVLICYCFNHQIRFNNSGKFNSSFGANRSSYNKNIKKNLISFVQALKSKEILFLNKDFREIDFNTLTYESLVYCDPPYLISEATYNKNWTEQEEIDLLNLLDRLNENKIKFALSNVLTHKGMENSYLTNWSKKYIINYINKDYPNCNYQLKTKDRKDTIEVLITNYSI